ncbi:hypothetical protein M501DRAFT_1020080 [Patellaria atrata CBS 101060]|uniref:Uncharacterized protein n=1 Tax=Patellaria atrata CBS 101060 TaxID=1346257 RepID=A0A9P4S3Z7_9PEZI|nr:hypothetical protein M501DRAFT_1020080 [Patellaria atrata CBS 101060]
MRGLPQRAKLFDFSRTMLLERDINAPPPHGADLTAPRRRPIAIPTVTTAERRRADISRMRRDQFREARSAHFNRIPQSDMVQDDHQFDGDIEASDILLPSRTEHILMQTVLRYEP